MENVWAVIVTYNRKALLLKCLAAVAAQTRRPDGIIIVDNASTDGTLDHLASEGWLHRDGVELLALDHNAGGAGGFAAGLARAVEVGADWVWMMDDDAEPHLDALEVLYARDLDHGNIYGSVAVSSDSLSWPMMHVSGGVGAEVSRVSDLSEEMPVQFIPFLGILVSAKMVERIGLPDAGFFLAVDDVEYCMRARRTGANVVLVGRSLVKHPASERYGISLFGRRFCSLRMAPWKRYYDVRNRLFVARSYYGHRFWYGTIPASFLRLFLTLLNEDERIQQIRAFFGGMVDGLLVRKGRRHQLWGIE